MWYIDGVNFKSKRYLTLGDTDKIKIILNFKCVNNNFFFNLPWWKLSYMTLLWSEFRRYFLVQNI